MGFGTLGLVSSVAGGNLPPGLFSDADLYMDFAGGIFIGTVIGNLTVARTTTGSVGSYVQQSSGTYTLFLDNTRRLTNLGLMVEDSRINVCIQNRDLTQAAWVATTMTAAKDQTGVDAIANSASSILATGASATILQSITLANSARWQTAFVKRITGTGTINMTMDNGGTWTAITVTAGWTRVSIPTQTITNPVVGFQIVTSGDKIAVDLVQNENSGFDASTPIPTVAAAVTRSADVVTLASIPTFGAANSMFFQGTTEIAINHPVSPWALSLSDGTANNLMVLQMDRTNGRPVTLLSVGGVSKYNVAIAANNRIGVSFKMASAVADSDQAAVESGGTANTHTSTPIFVPTVITVGGRADSTETWNGFVEKIAVWTTRRISNATMITLTT